MDNIKEHILKKHLIGKLAFYKELSEEDRNKILKAIYEAMDEWVVYCNEL